MAYTVAWDPTLPTGAEAANTLDDIIRSQVKVALEERLEDFLKIPDFTADPVRIGGLKLLDSADSVIALGDNAGTPRGLLIKNKAESTTYYSLGFNSLSLTLGTITTDINSLSITQTWNAAGVTFTGFKVNITSTASAAASKLFDFQLASVSKASLSKAGALTIADILTVSSGGFAVTGNSQVTGNLTVTGTTISDGLTITGTALIQGLTVGKGASALTTNTAFGISSISSATTGAHNVAYGYFSLKALTTGSENSVGGETAGANITTGIANTVWGQGGLQAATTASRCTAVGQSSMFLGNGDNNTGCGFETLSTGGGNGGVALGAFAGKYETGDNGFYVNNQDRSNLTGDKTKSLLYGVFNAAPASQSLTVNGKLLLPQGIDAGAGSVLISSAPALGGLAVEGTSSPKIYVQDTTTPVQAYLQADNSIAYFGSGTNHAVHVRVNDVTALTFATSLDATFASSVDATAYKVGGAAGVDFGPGLPTSITVVKGIVTAIS